MADHIFQKKGESVWYVRLDIPKDVRGFFDGSPVLVRSLKTGLRSEAMENRLYWLSRWKAEIKAARAAKEATADDWRAVQHASGLAAIESRKEAATRIYTPGLSTAETEPLNVMFEGVKEALEELYEDGQVELAQRLEKWAASYLSKIENGMTETEGMDLQNELIKITTDVGLLATAEEYSLSEEDKKEARNITLNPTLYKPRSPITKAMMNSWLEHIKTQIKTEKTQDRLLKSVQRISDYLAKDGEPLNFDTVHNFLSTLPAARTTRANYLWAGRTFWKWANKYQPAFREKYQNQPCPFDGHELPKTGEAAGIKRLAFSKEEIESLHRKAKEKRSGPLANLIQFAAYTGARLEEIGRIRPEHTIVDSSGEPIGFKITESKTDAGVRDMPLHPALVPLFKELSANASENDGFLFPGGNNKYGNRLDGLSKKFGRIKSKSFSKEYTFHSIRHSFTTLLHQAGVGIEILPYITGHETGSFTLAQYSKGPSFEMKAKAISLLVFDFTD